MVAFNTLLIGHPEPGTRLEHDKYSSGSATHTLLYPFVRSVGYVVAASDASNLDKAQADVVCDGVQDDVDIQAGIDYVADYGGTVLLTAGTFYVASTIVPADKVSIYGQGMGVTVLSFDHSVSDDAIGDVTSGTLSDVTIGRMTIIDTLGTPVQSWGVALGGWTDGAATLSNIEFYEIECEECGLWLANVTSPRCIIRNCYIHDLTAGDRALGTPWCDDAIIKENQIDTVAQMGIGCQGSTGLIIMGNTITGSGVDGTYYGIDTSSSTLVNIVGNYVYAPFGILSEDSTGLISVTGNILRGEATSAGTGIQVWRTATGKDQASRIIISNNNISEIKAGVVVLDEADATITANKIHSIGQYGVRIATTSGWTAPRYIQIAHNDIYDCPSVTAYGGPVYVSNTDYVDILYNNLDGNSNTNARGIQFASTTTAPNTRIIGNALKGVSAKANLMYGDTADMYVRDNQGFIAAGEIRTINGSISTLTENAYNSVDNPFGQDVLVLDETIYISTKATSGAPRLDCGIGSSATTDYTTVFDDITCETVGPYHSTNTTTIGKQTSPILWQTGTGNRYFNHSIKAAAATGMVASYSIRVMGI
jgi:hypothetical protein